MMTETTEKNFQISLAVNPLVAAAAPLLHLAGQLYQQHGTPNFGNLLRTLTQEIKIFEHQAYLQNYRPQLIIWARYLLCALLDEIILSTEWGANSVWELQNLLRVFHAENPRGENFFEILNRASQNLPSTIDLIELGYLCLSLGFKGHYREPTQQHGLGLLIERYYQLVRQHRGDFSPQLFVSDIDLKRKYKKHRWLFPPIWLIGAMTLGILALIFIPYYYRLNQLSKPLKQLPDILTIAPQQDAGQKP